MVPGAQFLSALMLSYSQYRLCFYVACTLLKPRNNAKVGHGRQLCEWQLVKSKALFSRTSIKRMLIRILVQTDLTDKIGWDE